MNTPDNEQDPACCVDFEVGEPVEQMETAEAPPPSKSQWKNRQIQQNWPFYELRYALREYLAEFFGTLVLVAFGDGVVATTVFCGGSLGAGQSNASYLAITFGWGLGLAMALYISMGISGGHLNPAVTIANCLFGTCPWSKCIGFIVAQMLGAMVGVTCMYGCFKGHFDEQEKNLAPGQTMTMAVGGIFCTYPKANVTTGQAAWSEIFNTMLLVMGILGIVDDRLTPATNFKPIAVGLLVFTIGICTGWNSGYAINVARDLGPRFVSAMIFKSNEPFTLNDHYFWVPMLMPIVGATLGMFLFTIFIIPN